MESLHDDNPYIAALSNCYSHVGLCNLLKVDPKTLNKALKNRKYQTFSIPKRTGGKRTIEYPPDDLMYVQKQIALVLNNVYKSYIPQCVHGYIPKAIIGYRRDIFTNAEVHAQSGPVLNLDLKDYFYSISTDHIINTMTAIIPGMDNDILNTIIKLVTYQCRLPVGSTVSPVMSNLVAINMDNQLTAFAASKTMKYTRYVDDMTFSAMPSSEITDDTIQGIDTIVQNNHLNLNMTKFKMYHENEPKVITGIVICDGKMDLLPELIDELKSNIKKFKTFRKTFQHMKMLGYNEIETYKAHYKQFKASIQGQLSFAKRVLGEQDQRYQKLQNKFEIYQSENHYITQVLYI